MDDDDEFVESFERFRAVFDALPAEQKRQVAEKLLRELIELEVDRLNGSSGRSL